LFFPTALYRDQTRYLDLQTYIFHYLVLGPALSTKQRQPATSRLESHAVLVKETQQAGAQLHTSCNKLRRSTKPLLSSVRWPTRPQPKGARPYSSSLPTYFVTHWTCPAPPACKQAPAMKQMLLQPAAASCNSQTANEIANEISRPAYSCSPSRSVLSHLTPRPKGRAVRAVIFPGGIAGRLRCTPRQQGTSHKELAAHAARSGNTHTRDPTAPG